jgi:hypothetical protein
MPNSCTAYIAIGMALIGKSAKLTAYLINDRPDTITHTRKMRT